MRGQKRDLFRRIAAADAPHDGRRLFIGAEAAHQRDKFIAAMRALDGGNTAATLTRYTMAALAAANQQGGILGLRENGPARQQHQAKYNLKLHDPFSPPQNILRERFSLTIIKPSHRFFGGQ